jgi:phage gp36-like protein
MAYCTQDEILLMLPERDLIQLANDTSADTVPDPDADPDPIEAAIAVVVDAAIAAADAEIDVYCSVRYTVPFDPVPAIINVSSIDIAIYNLYSRRDNVAVPEIRKNRYDAALKLLAAVESGRINLSVSEITGSGASSSSLASDRIFTIGKTAFVGTLDNY